ncbi:hypothetical protein BN7_1848 [Wickerhamomyces ciferrii]|uniref:Uncharacterized protein n=1 Tax=Wickerhamomyces ciferrii (strain ATCC 14091 / BCRC 22168 / CBS 111 / JCM 3599 / NBRC 0793 / NRRL Y-1031 F-60-10) TaxID=1206466 RepID=K0KLU7_WICCF|nr:uncharacterized protein BN7_1848 [Wickerhamomyces ciferrii]CCH42304.1 hypothetical protein BN7_1848 [Wickerhamomyces ciferrii]
MSATQIPIPDLRFESSFFNSLQSKANSEHQNKLSKQNIQQQELENPKGPVPITPGIIIQVILKDVLIMPLLQGIIWSGILIVAKPWLSYVARSGREYGVQLFQSLGFKSRQLKRV